MRGYLAISLAVWLLVWLLPLPPSAHSDAHPKHDRVEIEGSFLRVYLDYDIPPGGLAQKTRSLFDFDGDDHLSSKEKEKVVQYLRMAATRFLKISLNSKELSLSEKKFRVHGLDDPVSSSREITTLWILESSIKQLKRGRNVLSLRDRHKDLDVEVPVEFLLPGQPKKVAVLKGKLRELSVNFVWP